jgi:hypothetical protein
MPIAFLGFMLLASTIATFADPAPIDSTLFPLGRFAAEGNSPSAFFVAFEDRSLYETGFQIQWTFTKDTIRFNIGGVN